MWSSWKYFHQWDCEVVLSTHTSGHLFSTYWNVFSQAAVPHVPLIRSVHWNQWPHSWWAKEEWRCMAILGIHMSTLTLPPPVPLILCRLEQILTQWNYLRQEANVPSGESVSSKAEHGFLPFSPLLSRPPHALSNAGQPSVSKPSYIWSILFPPLL